MGDEQLTALEEKILKLTYELDNYEPGSEEFESRVKTINTLSQQVNAGRKIEADYDVNSDAEQHNHKARMAELDFKKDELEFRRTELAAKVEDDKRRSRNNLIIESGKAGIELGGIVIPLIFYSKFLTQGYLFETKGIISSNTFRNFLKFVKPKR